MSDTDGPRVNGLLVGALVGCVIVVLGLGAALAFVVLDRNKPAEPAAPVSAPAVAKVTEAEPSLSTPECVSNEDGRYGAVVTITNNSNEVQGYTVQVAFDSADGTQQVDIGSGALATVQPHERANLFAVGTKQAPDAEPVPTGTAWDDIRKALAAPPRTYHCRITGFVTH